MSGLDKEDRLFLVAGKAPCRSLNLCNRRLRYVPAHINLLQSSLITLLLQSNSIAELPSEVGELSNLECLNIGNNKLTSLPACLVQCRALSKLQLFNNPLESLKPTVLGSLTNLTVLNLNGCRLQEIPSTIGRLTVLESLSLNDNRVSRLPKDVGNLSQLRALHVSNNQLERLPGAIGQCTNLESLVARKNKLTALPRTIGKCTKLRVLDMAVNLISFYPAEEFHTECNQLIPKLPIVPPEKNEVLPLKEIVGRQLVTELLQRGDMAKLMRKYRPDLYDQLAAAQKCCVCDKYFISTCIECVHYINTKKIFSLQQGGSRVPVQALMCSHQCFRDQPGSTEYYGILHLPMT